MPTSDITTKKLGIRRPYCRRLLKLLFSSLLAQRIAIEAYKRRGNYSNLDMFSLSSIDQTLWEKVPGQLLLHSWGTEIVETRRHKSNFRGLPPLHLPHPRSPILDRLHSSSIPVRVAGHDWLEISRMKK